MLVRRITCIFFLLIFLFNLFGYRVVLHYWKHSQDELSFTAPYNHTKASKDLVEIRIPLKMAYIADNGTFDYSDGEIEYNGKFYRYVSGEIDGQFFIVRCIPNLEKTKSAFAKNALIGMIADPTKQTPSKKEGGNGSVPVFKAIGDCIVYLQGEGFNRWSLLSFDYGSKPSPALATRLISSPWQPPECKS